MNGTGDVVSTARVLRERRARLDADEVEFLASVAADTEDLPGLAEELAPELRVSVREVENRIHAALDLTTRMPRVLVAMRDGLMDAYGARRVLHVTAPLSDEHAREVDELLAEKLARAPVSTWQPVNMVRHVSRLVHQIDPGGATARARQANAGRKVELLHGEHAQSRLTLDLRSEVASACYARMDSMARRLRRNGETRTLDQLRADIAADLLLGNDPGVAVPEAAAQVYLHMPIDAALAITDNGCELDGYGPVPGPVAREIMTNTASIWRKVICDPATGGPVDLGRTRRRPSATMRELVRVRDRECTVPWCHRPARHCDIDHEREWAAHQGGTSIDNTGPRCRRHHRRKNAPGWITRYDPTHGTTAITTPRGATHTGHRSPILTPRAQATDEPPPF
ncbi:HNH endonuclease signature motif containing protein [Prauserella rugosa]|uniref:Uncharacterized protein DUF222 n=1 Tax=Prauserella rugosa TaxID=43354 RepID=A0A660C956_9PSEU|nr:HNH endonuclease signature motif containing protein [Prauserella rugosa]TWH19982.1 uncharacterized protein DUF222 [Prauserella rugosa]